MKKFQNPSFNLLSFFLVSALMVIVYGFSCSGFHIQRECNVSMMFSVVVTWLMRSGHLFMNILESESGRGIQ